MKKLIIYIFILIIIPVLFVNVEVKKKRKVNYGYVNNLVIKVKEKNGTIIKVPLEKYVYGVVAGELPASFNIEALKAQAVASRTYVLNKLGKSKLYDVTSTTSDQVYLTSEELKEKWKNNYEQNSKKIKDAVDTTRGEVILYNNNLIDSLFFSTSNGYTENSKDVFSKQEPYLLSVSSPWDEKESPVFKSENVITKKEFLLNLGLQSSDNINITDVIKTKTGMVKTLKINGKKFSSKEIRKIFNLRSYSFNIKVDNNIIIETKGYGHGVGMSQYGANGMAKEGYNYKEILKHYYKNCEIKKIN